MSEPNFIKQQNELEQKILSSILFKPENLPHLGITADYFKIDINRKIYKTILKCYDREHNEIVQSDLSKELSPSEINYYTELLNSGFSDFQLERYIQALSENHIRANSVHLLENMQNGFISIDECLGELKKLQDANLFTTQEHLPTSNEIYNALQHGTNILEFNQFKRLEENVRFNTGSLHVIGARTGIGKSAFALNLMNDLSKNKKYKCIYLNIEMSEQSLYKRLMGMDSRTQINSLSYLPKEEISKIWQPIEERNTSIKHGQLYIEDVNRIILRDQKKAENKDKHIIVFIDYLGLVRTKKKYSNRTEQIGEVVRELKEITLDSKCTMFLLAQINRGVTDQKGKERTPTLTDLKESGEIEQTADTVILLSDLTKLEIGANDEPYSIMMFDVAKNRNWSMCKIYAKYHKETQLFVEIGKKEKEETFAKLQRGGH